MNPMNPVIGSPLVRSPSERLLDDALPLPFLDDPSFLAERGREINRADFYKPTTDDSTSAQRDKILEDMHADEPLGGEDMAYGNRKTQKLRFWKGESTKAPIVVFIHGGIGMWQSGSYLNSTGSAKVRYLTELGYAFASVNYSLRISMPAQLDQVAHAIAYLIKNAATLDIDPEGGVLMGHSSGAHLATLLGTDKTYLKKAKVNFGVLHGVIALDGINYNAAAERADNPGEIADNTEKRLGTKPEKLMALSPTHHTHLPNAGAFLFLHVQRRGGIRQATEFAVALKAVGTPADVHVFESESFVAHIQILLRLGMTNYPATAVMDEWLDKHVPIDT